MRINNSYSARARTNRERECIRCRFLSSQNELADSVKIHEPLGNSDHNQIHFDIKVKSESKNKNKYRKKHLAHKIRKGSRLQ